jgi:hypothetical protein
MPDSREAPRTVLISSRMDELGSSRRAAFRAVHDEGWIPLLYEVEPDELIATHRSASSEESRNLQESHVQRLNERLSMDGVLDKAEHFIGVYGTSLGDPSPQLCGLRPLEYEFLRFLDTHASRRAREKGASLRRLFSMGSSPDNCHTARTELKHAFEQIRKNSSPHHAVFQQRVAMFLKRNYGDVPASSLMYHTILSLNEGVSKGPVRFFSPKPQRLPHGETVYRRPSSDLYMQIRLQIREWRKKKLSPSQEPGAKKGAFWIKVRSLERVGFALEVVEAVFYAGYNVLKLKMGQETRTSDTRVIYMQVEAYLSAPPKDELIEILCEKHRYDARPIGKPPTKLRRHVSEGQKWKLTTIVAHRPGMLARVLTALALNHMRVLSITLEPYESTSGGPRKRVRLTFDKAPTDKTKRKKDQDPPYPEDSQFALDFIAAELASLPGFYAVTPAQAL